MDFRYFRDGPTVADEPDIQAFIDAFHANSGVPSDQPYSPVATFKLLSKLIRTVAIISLGLFKLSEELRQTQKPIF